MTTGETDGDTFYGYSFRAKQAISVSDVRGKPTTKLTSPRTVSGTSLSTLATHHGGIFTTNGLSDRELSHVPSVINHAELRTTQG